MKDIDLNGKYVLMCKNVIVGEMLLGEWKVFHKNLVPKGLTIIIAKDSRDMFKAVTESWNSFVTWCAGRTVSISRLYVKQILKELGLPQSQDLATKARISLEYKCVSLCDSYWVRGIDEEVIRWEDLDPRINSTDEVITSISLRGTFSTFRSKKKGLPVELSTVGYFPKGWIRNRAGELELHKIDLQNNEVKREVCASKIIDCFNVYGNLRYSYGSAYGLKTSKCKLMTSTDLGIVHADEMQIWCSQNGTNLISYVEQNYLKEFSQMLVIDYLLANDDRHGYNWGFYQSMDSGDILGLHPLYDHNSCFESGALIHENSSSSTILGTTLESNALKYIGFSELKLTTVPSLDMFPDENCYAIFKQRCRQLGIESNIKDVNVFD